MDDYQIEDIVWYYYNVTESAVIGEITDLKPHQFLQYRRATVRNKESSYDIDMLQLNITKKSSKMDAFLFKFKNYYV